MQNLSQRHCIVYRSFESKVNLVSELIARTHFKSLFPEKIMALKRGSGLNSNVRWMSYNSTQV